MADPQLAPSDSAFRFARCEHERQAPRRVCDVCKTDRYAFMACSYRCLRAHQQVAHDPDLPADAATRARRARADRNRHAADLWDRYAGHRERLMEAIPAGASGGRLCVLGAGNCHDVDLPRLAHRFAEIHLVDFDGEAIERARDRQPSRVRDAIVLHGGVDLSGLLARMDEWGDAFPDDRTLHEAVFSAAHEVAGALSVPFEVTVSTCVLSQLIVPFQDAWAADEETWSKLSAATTAVHVGTLARVTAPGGAACLVFDVLSSEDAPGLTRLRAHGPGELQAAVDAGARSGAIALHPDPRALLAEIGDSGIAAVEPGAPGARLNGPWLWDIGTALQLVYALNFRRA